MSTNYLDVHSYEWHVVVNPNACEGKCLKLWNEVSGLLSLRNIKWVLHQAEATGKGMEIASQLCTEGHRHLLVVGGDGTLNEVVNGIFQSGVDTQEVYLAVLPLGRGNDWARTHHFPADNEENVRIFDKGQFMRHDIGLVKTFQNGSELDRRYFINIAGFGFDAEVIYDVTHNRPRFLGVSVYILGLLRTVLRYRSRRVRVCAPGFDFEGKSFLMVAAICQYNGGGMRQAPMAVPDDGLLDLVLIPKVGLLTVFANIGKIFSGEHIRSIKGIRTCRADRIGIVASDPFRGEVEGELLPQGDYRVEALPRALNVLTALD
mgnify:CR=1 FL=1